MRVEIPLYEGFDELDAFGPFEVLAGAQRAGAPFDVHLVAAHAAGEIASTRGARVVVDSVLSDAAELVVVPGGIWRDAAARRGARSEVRRGDLPRAIAAAHARGATIASVCTGAMLLAAAGLLDGRPAVTHHAALDDLRAAGADVRAEARVVDTGDVLTAGGVTSGIDLALWLVEREAGVEAAQRSERSLEYTRAGPVLDLRPTR